MWCASFCLGRWAAPDPTPGPSPGRPAPLLPHPRLPSCAGSVTPAAHLPRLPNPPAASCPPGCFLCGIRPSLVLLPTWSPQPHASAPGHGPPAQRRAGGDWASHAPRQLSSGPAWGFPPDPSPLSLLAFGGTQLREERGPVVTLTSQTQLHRTLPVSHHPRETWAMCPE